mgnify:CR=1 FL=1
MESADNLKARGYDLSARNPVLNEREALPAAIVVLPAPLFRAQRARGAAPSRRTDRPPAGADARADEHFGEPARDGEQRGEAANGD